MAGSRCSAEPSAVCRERATLMSSGPPASSRLMLMRPAGSRRSGRHERQCLSIPSEITAGCPYDFRKSAGSREKPRRCIRRWDGHRRSGRPDRARWCGVPPAAADRRFPLRRPGSRHPEQGDEPDRGRLGAAVPDGHGFLRCHRRPLDHHREPPRRQPDRRMVRRGLGHPAEVGDALSRPCRSAGRHRRRPARRS